MIDWKLATTVAEGIAEPQARPRGDRPFEHVAGPAEEAERLVSAYTGLTRRRALPHAEPVDRPLWIQANLTLAADGARPGGGHASASGMGPLSGAVGAAAGALLAVEVGAVSGLLGQRVLGQYEFPILEPEAPARLLFVAPEPRRRRRSALERRARRAAALGRAARDHARAAVRRRAVAAPAPRRDGARAARRRSRSTRRGCCKLPDTLRPARLDRRQGPRGRPRDADRRPRAPRARSTRMQAFMAVLEGYAEHVMDAVGAEILPEPAAAARRAWTAAAATAPACCGSSRS